MARKKDPSIYRLNIYTFSLSWSCRSLPCRTFKLAVLYKMQRNTVFFVLKNHCTLLTLWLYPPFLLELPTSDNTMAPTHQHIHPTTTHPFPPTLCSGLVIKLSVELGFEKCTPDSTSGSPLMFRIHYVIISEAIVTCVALPINYHYTRPLVKPVGRPWADHVHFRSQLSGCIGLSLGLNQTLRQAWITITSGIMVTENILFLIL